MLYVYIVYVFFGRRILGPHFCTEALGRPTDVTAMGLQMMMLCLGVKMAKVGCYRVHINLICGGCAIYFGNYCKWDPCLGGMKLDANVIMVILEGFP